MAGHYDDGYCSDLTDSPPPESRPHHWRPDDGGRKGCSVHVRQGRENGDRYHEINCKRQKAAPSNNDSEDGSETLIGYVKDSQEEVSGPLDGLQDAKACVDEQAIAELESRESARGDEDELNHRGPASGVHIEQQAYSHPNKKLGWATCWKGKQSQQFTGQDSQVCTSQISASLGRKTDNVSHAQKLQDVTRRVTKNDTRPFARFQDSDLNLEPRGIPLALRLQELVQQANKLDGQHDIFGNELASSNDKCGSAMEDDIVESIDSDDDSQGNKVDGQQDIYGNKLASSNDKRGSAIEDDIEEIFDSDNDPQNKVPDKGTTGVPVVSASLLWNEFREALKSAPVDTNPTIRVNHNSKRKLSGFSARLQHTLQELQSQQMRFESTLTLGQSLHGLSKCLLVLILRKNLEAQLTTCQCKVLQSPANWNSCSGVAMVGGEDVHNLPIVEVMFSSRTRPELTLDIGRIVRVHPPWHEIVGVTKSSKIIVGTFFCEMVQ